MREVLAAFLVDRRVGGLEMIALGRFIPIGVDRRVGGLESGSLELKL